MEIFFCDSCGRRVSDAEIERGEGHKDGDQIWCAGCMQQAGIVAGPPAPERRRTTQIRARTPGPPRTPKPPRAPKMVRRPASGPSARPAPRTRQQAPPAKAGSGVGLYAGLFTLGVGLGVVILLMARGRGGTKGTAPARGPERRVPPADVAVPADTAVPADAAAPADTAVPADAAAPGAADAPKGGSRTASTGGTDTAFAKISLEAALGYAREHPDDVRGQVFKFESVSRNHAGTLSADRAAEEVRRLKAARPGLFEDEVTVKPYKIPEPDRTRHECPRRSGAVTIDGRLDEWNELPQECREPRLIKITKESWTGPADCRFRFAVAYDDSFLYVAVETTDDVFFQETPETHPWAQDGIEIRVDARPEPQRSLGRGANEFVDHQLVALSPSETPDQLYAFEKDRWYPGIRAVCLKTPKGHNTEVAFPVSRLNGKQGREWREFRLNIAVDDYEPKPEGGKVGAQIWWRVDWRTDGNVPASGTFVRR